MESAGLFLRWQKYVIGVVDAVVGWIMENSEGGPEKYLTEDLRFATFPFDLTLTPYAPSAESADEDYKLVVLHGVDICSFS